MLFLLNFSFVWKQVQARLREDERPWWTEPSHSRWDHPRPVSHQLTCHPEMYEWQRLKKAVSVHNQSFRHVWLFVTPRTVAHQVPLSMEFSRQAYWSGLPLSTPVDLLNPGIEPVPPVSPALTGGFFTTVPPGKPEISWALKLAAAAAKSLQSYLTLCDPIDGNPPGSPVPGILQARTLECVAISFSNAWKWKVKVKSLSRVWLLATPRIAAYQASLSMGFSTQKYWSGVPLPSPEISWAQLKSTKPRAPSQSIDFWKIIDSCCFKVLLLATANWTVNEY